MELFGRRVAFRIENADPSFEKFPSRTVGDLNVEFDVDRTLEKEPSTLRATAYNLSEDTRKALEEPERALITLEVGYGEDLFQIFTGDLRNVRHRRQGPDLLTEIEAGDGEKGSANWARKWFPKNTKLDTVLKYLVGKAGVGAGNIGEAVKTYERNGVPTVFKNGCHVQGYAVDELNEILRSRGVEFSIQNNQIQILPSGKPLEGVPVVKLSRTSGLIGSPTLDNEGTMSATTKMVPGVFPGSLVDVESEFVQGRFRVVRATYSGSIFGDSFDISIEGKQPK